MKNIFTFFALLLLTSAVCNAQTTATDFTATDCSSTSHSLFNELNSGKVVVMTWVMPCGTCIGPAKAAYNAVQSYSISHPGKVAFYLVSDYGDDSCSILTNWVTTNNIGNPSNMSIFNNVGNPISMGSYGTAGMPKTVVVGGANHMVYMNKNNAQANNADTLTYAINSALGITSVADLNNAISFSVSPNPVRSDMTIMGAKAVTKIVIMSLSGQVVKEERYTTAIANPSINMSQLAAGVYVVKVTDADDRTGIQKIVKQ